MTKNEVILSSLWQVTIYASFQRARVYTSDADNEIRKGVKESLESAINSKLIHYIERKVTEKDHVKYIKQISKKINTKWGDYLLENEIPIGVVQKSFNLYLKLMWCLKKIKEPPHCPKDKVIIDFLPRKHRTSWTKIRDIETYNNLITNLKVLAEKKKLSLAKWELSEYKKP